MTSTFRLGTAPTQDTIYHVYIRTHEEAHLFGQIVGEAVQLNEIGQLVALQWQQTAQTYRSVRLDQWTTLPNGIRALVTVEGDSSEPSGRSRFKPRALSSFIATFKAATAKRVNLLRAQPDAPVWQPSYHEQRIDDEVTLARIRQVLGRGVGQ